MISRWIDAEPDMVVAASLRTGRDAVNQIERVNPDVVVLDIEMPDLDGIAALPLLLAKKRDLIVIMASTLTRRNAEVSLKALSLGAADYIPKPASTREVTDFRDLPARPDREDPPPRRKATRGAGRARARRWRRLPPRERAHSVSVASRAPCRTAAARSLRPFAHAGAARAADRLLDRRPAGADDAGGPKSGRCSSAPRY